jgi:hypothetical protein
MLAVLKREKYLYKYKVSNQNIFIYTYLVQQFFAFLFARSTSWYVSHGQLGGLRVDGLGMEIYFGILHHIHYKYIPVPRHVARAFSCGGSKHP